MDKEGTIFLLPLLQYIVCIMTFFIIMIPLWNPLIERPNATRIDFDKFSEGGFAARSFDSIPKGSSLRLLVWYLLVAEPAERAGSPSFFGSASSLSVGTCSSRQSSPPSPASRRGCRCAARGCRSTGAKPLRLPRTVIQNRPKIGV